MPGGKFTDHVFSAMKEKDILRMEGPFGSFFLREDSDKPIVLLASGTGFPIKALIERTLATWAASAPWCMYWGKPQGGPYLSSWAEQVAQAWPLLRFVPVLSEADAGWTGRTGFVHQAVMADLPTSRATRSALRCR